MAWMECDICKGTEYTEENPFVNICQQRPSDKTDMCCVMAGHAKCLGVEKLPDIGITGGVATPKQWEDWIESAEAQKLGYLFLT